ncbi:MAG: glycosyltransferase [bacterium]|nr:glycosyltransferase [bacterium]
MKILYVAPEHVSGTLSLFKREHERRGDTCRFVTFWHSQWDFPDDICLNLHGMPNRAWVKSLRKAVASEPHDVPSRVVNGMLPIWNPNPIIRAMFALRDERNWKLIWRAVQEYGLFDFDILHLDGGADFTRDARFARAFKQSGKGVISYFHGSDLRARGYIPEVDAITDLRLTPEWDLAALDARLHYSYLPVALDSFEYRQYNPSGKIRVGHAARNPLKGTVHVLEAIVQLKTTNDVEFVLIKDMSYSEALTAKRSCDLFVDQLTNEGGWGYGMSGVEALAMGIPVITNIPSEMRPLIGGHPFIQADPTTIANVLQSCINSPELMRSVSESGRNWAVERHSVERVTDSLYAHYKKMGWLKS